MRAIQHPDETALALHAGGDLGPIARWRCARHLKRCPACREEIAAFQGVRRMVAEWPAAPELPWEDLAAEMRANIRLRVAAGECEGGERPQTEGAARFTGWRAAMALASLAVVVAAGLLWRHPAPPVAPAGDGMAATEAAAGGRRDPRIKDVTYSANADGSTGDSFVDPVTGYVTVRREW